MTRRNFAEDLSLQTLTFSRKVWFNKNQYSTKFVTSSENLQSLSNNEEIIETMSNQLVGSVQHSWTFLSIWHHIENGSHALSLTQNFSSTLLSLCLHISFSSTSPYPRWRRERDSEVSSYLSVKCYVGKNFSSHSASLAQW